MKDYEALSKKHFDSQAAEYDRRDTYYYSQNGKISCKDMIVTPALCSDLVDRFQQCLHIQQ